MTDSIRKYLQNEYNDFSPPLEWIEHGVPRYTDTLCSMERIANFVTQSIQFTQEPLIENVCDYKVSANVTDHLIKKCGSIFTVNGKLYSRLPDPTHLKFVDGWCSIQIVFMCFTSNIAHQAVLIFDVSRKQVCCLDPNGVYNYFNSRNSRSNMYIDALLKSYTKTIQFNYIPICEWNTSNININDGRYLTTILKRGGHCAPLSIFLRIIVVDMKKEPIEAMELLHTMDTNELALLIFDFYVGCFKKNEKIQRDLIDVMHVIQRTLSEK